MKMFQVFIIFTLAIKIINKLKLNSRHRHNSSLKRIKKGNINYFTTQCRVLLQQFTS